MLAHAAAADPCHLPDLVLSAESRALMLPNGWYTSTGRPPSQVWTCLPAGMSRPATTNTCVSLFVPKVPLVQLLSHPRPWHAANLKWPARPCCSHPCQGLARIRQPRLSKPAGSGHRALDHPIQASGRLMHALFQLCWLTCLRLRSVGQQGASARDADLAARGNTATVAMG